MMELTSTVFTDGGLIPARYTCDGENHHPPIIWTGAPTGTRTFVLLMEDPDVPRNIRPDGLFIHWLAWNIPVTTQSIPEHTEPAGVIGLNTAGRLGYTGPCPPDRQHRYFFRLYALSTQLDVASDATKGDVLAAMDGHILDRAELMGRYDRRR